MALFATESASEPASYGAKPALLRDGWRGKEFDLVALPPRQRVDAGPITTADIPNLLRIAGAAMGVSLASEDVVTRIACAHPHAVWSFRRNERVVGGVALLMLNASGLAALLQDSFDLNDPPAALMVAPGERPAAIYVWAILGVAFASEGIAHAIIRLQQPPYEQADLYAMPATDAGLRFTCGLGFTLVPGRSRPLYRYVRLANRVHTGSEGVQ
jgi:hypothetical protein